MTGFAAIASFLQSDALYWAAMKHRHLVAAYVVTWVIQLSYAAWVARRWFRSAP